MTASVGRRVKHVVDMRFTSTYLYHGTLENGGAYKVPGPFMEMLHPVREVGPLRLVPRGRLAPLASV